MTYSRFAIYYLPPAGPLSDFGAKWLGWDVQQGRSAPQPQIPGLRDLTTKPRKYGFHATLKPPFRLAPGHTPQALEAALAHMATTLTPASCDGLALTHHSGFLALTLSGTADPINHLAETCVRTLDPFRAPPPPSELARRRKTGLSPRQDALLTAWGYPYVMEEFRFHMTLTQRLPPETQNHWAATAKTLLPPLPAPFTLTEIALCGERPDGRFERIRHFPL